MGATKKSNIFVKFLIHDLMAPLKPGLKGELPHVAVQVDFLTVRPPISLSSLHTTLSTVSTIYISRTGRRQRKKCTYIIDNRLQ